MLKEIPLSTQVDFARKEIAKITPNFIDFNLNETGMHNLVCQLSSLFSLITDLNKKPYKLFERLGEIRELSIDEETVQAEVVNMDILPATIFDEVFSSSEFEENSENFKKFIENSEKILLAGCVTIKSAFYTVKKLSDLGFKGELNVIDRAVNPLLLIDIFSGQKIWQDYFGIKVNTYQADLNLLCIDVFSKSHDMVITDILGHYFDVIDNNFANLLTDFLKPDSGILVVRDLGEFQKTKTSKRDISIKSQEEKEARYKKLEKWLEEKFNIELSVDEIIRLHNEQWTDKNHGLRGQYLPQLYSFLFSEIEGLEEIYSGLTVTETNNTNINPNRYFMTKIWVGENVRI